MCEMSNESVKYCVNTEMCATEAVLKAWTAALQATCCILFCKLRQH
jgi:hypothetical protein